MSGTAPTAARRPLLRTVFISDLHLGSRHCQAAALAQFLDTLSCQRLYLVGDIVDLWWLTKRRATWAAPHQKVFEALRRIARSGTELIYIPGNHDRPLRDFTGIALPRLSVRRRAVHRTADGRRLLVTHGDEFDAATRLGLVQERVGDKLYDLILEGNVLLNRVRRLLGLRYWSLADFLKRKSSAAERYIERFRRASVEEARRRGLDGIVCGHIHRAELETIDGVVYANDGDWVESLSALVERQDGKLELLRFGSEVAAEAVGERVDPLRAAA